MRRAKHRKKRNIRGHGVAVVALAAVLLVGAGERPSSGPSLIASSPTQAPGMSLVPGARSESQAGFDHFPRTPESVISSPVAPTTVIERPNRVSVPAIGVDAPVIPLGLEADGSLEVPKDFSQAGWHTGGPEPGEPGPAVIAGHVDSFIGPAVFFRLSQLRPGDVIDVIGADGTTLRYQVERVEQYAKDAFPTDAVYGSTPQSTLRLITCGGYFDRARKTYDANIVVYGVVA